MFSLILKMITEKTPRIARYFAEVQPNQTLPLHLEDQNPESMDQSKYRWHSYHVSVYF